MQKIFASLAFLGLPLLGCSGEVCPGLESCKRITALQLEWGVDSLLLSSSVEKKFAANWQLALNYLKDTSVDDGNSNGSIGADCSDCMIYYTLVELKFSTGYSEDTEIVYEPMMNVVGIAGSGGGRLIWFSIDDVFAADTFTVFAKMVADFDTSIVFDDTIRVDLNGFE